MICFRSIFHTMMHSGRHTSTGHVWNNGCHNCPVQLINLLLPSNQSVSPFANTGYIPALNEGPSLTVAQKGGSRMVMSLLHEAARGNSRNRLPQDVFKSMTARLSRENVTEGWCAVKLAQHKVFLSMADSPGYESVCLGEVIYLQNIVCGAKEKWMKDYILRTNIMVFKSKTKAGRRLKAVTS